MNVEVIYDKDSFPSGQSRKDVPHVTSSFQDMEEGNVLYSPTKTPNNANVVDDAYNQSNVSTTKSNHRQALSMIAEQTILEKLVALFSFVVLASAIASLVMVGGYIVKAASIIMLLLSPYSYYQQTRITDIRALKETYGVLKGEVDQLSESNQVLRSKVGDLNSAVDKLQDMENVLGAISETKGQSVESLLETVQENESIVQQMEQNVRAIVLQNILSVVFSSDANGDKKLSNEETNALIESLKEINGLHVNQREFRRIVKENEGSIHGISLIIGQLLEEESSSSTASSDENRLFVFEMIHP